MNCTNNHGGTGEWTELHQLEVEGQGDNGENEEYIEESDCEESDQELSDEEMNRISWNLFLAKNSKVLLHSHKLESCMHVCLYVQTRRSLFPIIFF